MINLVSVIIAAPLALFTLVVLVEVALGAAPARRRQSDRPWGSRTTVLIPAHDEAKGVGAMLRALFSALPANTNVLLVADNCSDETASIARAAGAQVLERADLIRRGKGYALDHGREWLSHASPPPACVVVLDADTVPLDGGLADLAAMAVATDRPVQATYLLEPKASDAASVRFSAAAFMVKNLIRQLGAKRLGAPALLTGSGMAFPWHNFVDLPLATGHVAEDLMLGVESTLAGYPPVFHPTVQVVGETSSSGGTTTQRRRWESGTMEVAMAYAGRLLAEGARRRKPGLWWNALQLFTPPLILLIALDGLACVLLLGLAFVGASLLVPAALAALMVAVIILIPIAIGLHGRRDLLTGWRDIPRYMLWKAGLSLSVIGRRERRWIRTERD